MTSTTTCTTRTASTTATTCAYLCTKQIPIVATTHGCCLVFAKLAGKVIVTTVCIHRAVAMMLRLKFTLIVGLNGGGTLSTIQAHMVIDVIIALATLFGRCLAQVSTKTGRTHTAHVFFNFLEGPTVIHGSFGRSIDSDKANTFVLTF